MPRTTQTPANGLLLKYGRKINKPKRGNSSAKDGKTQQAILTRNYGIPLLAVTRAVGIWDACKSTIMLKRKDSKDMTRGMQSTMYESDMKSTKQTDSLRGAEANGRDLSHLVKTGATVTRWCSANVMGLGRSC